MKLGPFKDKKFFNVTVENIQSKRCDVISANCGSICTVQIQTCTELQDWLEKNRKDLRKGMVLVCNTAMPRASYEFIAEIELVNNDASVEIKPGYQPVINTQTSRQAANIVMEIKAPEDQSLL